jgi:hypothetical protein
MMSSLTILAKVVMGSIAVSLETQYLQVRTQEVSKDTMITRQPGNK